MSTTTTTATTAGTDGRCANNSESKPRDDQDHGIQLRPCVANGSRVGHTSAAVAWRREFPRAQFLFFCNACYEYYCNGSVRRDRPPDRTNYPQLPKDMRREHRDAILDVFAFIRMSSPEWVKCSKSVA